MRHIIIFLLSISVSLGQSYQTITQSVSTANADSLVLRVGTNGTVTIYKDGHAKRIPALTGNAGKFLSNTGTGYEWQTIAGGGDMLKTDNLSGLANYTTARTNLGLGSLATQSGTFSGTSSGTNTGDQTIIGYTLSVQALTSSPTDGQTVYFGNLPKAPTTTAAISKIYIRQAGTIKRAEIYCYSGTAGTAESWSVYIRKNNTTDALIGTLTVSTSERVFTNTGLNISVSAGDYVEIKSINPTWATNPLTTIWGGYIYIE